MTPWQIKQMKVFVKASRDWRREMQDAIEKEDWERAIEIIERRNQLTEDAMRFLKSIVKCN